MTILYSDNSLTLIEHSSSDYAPRTKYNAESADVTLAFAVDFSTFGEILTKKVSRNLIEFDLKNPFTEELPKFISKYETINPRRINIAGNGIYTLHKFKWDQASINKTIYFTMMFMKQISEIDMVYSGGQTGADIAGIAAALALDLKATLVMPKGLKQRNFQMKPVYRDTYELIDEIYQFTKVLKCIKI